MNLQEFKTLPLLGILRGIDEEMVSPIVDIIQETGLKAIEVTMNTPNASKLIAEMRRLSDGEFYVGAGTVVSFSDLQAALDAGASFIVSPGTNPDVVSFCVDHKISIFPGALTPSEVMNAALLGASMIKVFPASVFGPKYLKELRGPLDQVDLLACGGISTTTIKDYFDNGATAAAFGGSIFNLEKLRNKDYKSVEIALLELIKSYWESKL